MRFNLFQKPSIERERKQFVMDFTIKQPILINNCDKFVACKEKLSTNFVLALKDPNSTEIMQVANKSDIEFYEGYDIAVEYTDSQRRMIAEKLAQVYNLIAQALDCFAKLENKANNDKKYLYNDKKIEFTVFGNIILNIFKHITMTDNVPEINNSNCPNTVSELMVYLQTVITEIVNILLQIDGGLIIEYITKQINLIIDKLLLYLNGVRRE